MSILSAWQKRDLIAFQEALKQDKSAINNLHLSEGYLTLLESIVQTLSPDSKDFAEALLAAGANVNIPNAITGKTPLHLAAEALNYSVIQVLLKFGADISATDLHDSNTVLHILSKKVAPHLSQQQDKCLDLFLNSPDLYLDQKNSQKITPVLAAYEQGAWRVMLKLLKAGASIDDIDYKIDGKQSLRNEIQERCPEILQVLPSADFTYSGPHATIALLEQYLNSGSEDRFCYEFNIYMADVRKRESKECQEDCLKLLIISIKGQLLKPFTVLLSFIRHNLGPDTKKNFFMSQALLEACRIGQEEMVKNLLEDDNTDDIEIGPSLCILAEEQPFTERHKRCLKLIAGKSDINEKNQNDETALHIACKMDNDTVTEILLENGANIFQVNTYGQYVYELIPDEILNKFLDTKIQKDVKSNSYFLNLDFLKNIETKNEENLTKSEGLELKSTERDVENLNSKIHKNEMKFLSRFTGSSKGSFITHPVFKTLLTVKWSTFLPLFYINVFVSFIFDATLILYVYDTLEQLPEVQHTATRIILLVFLSVFFIFSILNPPTLKYLLRADVWLSYILIILSFAILVRNAHSYPNGFQLVFIVTGITAAVHFFIQIGPHPWFCTSYVICRKIIRNGLKTLLPYLLAIYVVEFAVAFHNEMSCVFRYAVFAVFLVHFVGIGVAVVAKVSKKRDYYQLSTQARVLADYENRFFHQPRWNFRFLSKYSLLPKFRGFDVFARRHEWLRVNLNNGNVVEGFRIRPRWWSQAAKLDEKTVNEIQKISRNRRVELIVETSEKNSDLKVLLAKTESLMDPMRHYSVMLEKLENKTKDVENFLIQIMRVISLKEDN